MDTDQVLKHTHNQ